MERLAITRGKEGYSFIFFLAAQVIFMILQGVSGIDGGGVAIFFGVHLRARIMDHVLLIAQFLNMSLYMLGSASNYLEGYGVYEITRICKKNKLARIVNFIILKKLVAYEAIKIIMLLVLMRATGTGRVAVEAKSLIYSVLLSILIDYLFITIQMIIEVILDSRIGVMTISIVYVALLMIPSVAGMRRASPLCFLPLIPNLPMIARVDTQSIWYITLPFVIVLTIISWIIFIKVIKRKDLI